MSELTHNHDDQDNDQIFDRLVDGELSAEERQRLLASLDSSEDGWRRCALAFLEAQAWRQQFGQMLAEPAEQPSRQLAAPAAVNASHTPSWFAIAAGVMMAFTVGWLVRNPAATDHPVDGKIVQIDQQDRQTLDEMPVEKVSDQDAVTLYVRDTSGKNRRFRVPLVEAKDMKNQSDSVLANFPVQIREQFQDKGLDVKRRRRFAPMFFEQNERVVPMVVPVDDTYIVPVSRPVY